MQARAEKSPIYQDESLSDMAKKGESSFLHLSFLFHLDLLNIGQQLIVGLYYCELHAASQIELQAPEYRWKFNKARQGWLMRNVWNDVEVSLPLLPFCSRPAGERVEKQKS
jgi:hypothetical protein